MVSSRRSAAQYAVPTATMAVLILLWEVAVRAFRVPELFLPAPSLIAQETWRWLPALLSNAAVTLYETLLGFALGVLVGIPIALSIVYSPLLQNTIFPLIVVSQSVPKVAVAPLFLVWLGYGLAPKVLVGFLVTFFPIVVNTAAGLGSVEPDLIDLIRTLGASRPVEFRKIRIPHALPFMFTGFKVSITLAVIGALIGEFVAADKGLGYMILVASAQLKMGVLFACLAFLALMGIVLFYAVAGLERVLLPWNFLGEAEDGRGREATA